MDVVEQLIDRALAPATRRSYEMSLADFTVVSGKELRAAESNDIENYIGHLFVKKLQHSTIRSMVAGLAYWLKLWNFPGITKTFRIKQVMKGIGVERPTLPDARAPISLRQLALLIDTLPSVCYSPYEAVLFADAFALIYWGCLRGGEVCEDMGIMHLAFKSVKIANGSVALHLFSTKTARGRTQAIKISVQDMPTCPVHWTKQFLSIRKKTPLNAAFFVHADYASLRKSQLTYVFKRAAQMSGLPNGITLHSLRIGRASSQHFAGASREDIMSLGRWTSNAYKRYLRPFDA